MEQIDVSFIDNIIKSNIKYEEWYSNTDMWGNPDKNGSIEFEIIDKDNRLWGGRFVIIEDKKILVEFFSKIFFSDLSVNELQNGNNNEKNILKQLIDDSANYL